MSAEIIRLGIPTTAPHRPDDILEAAKEQGIETVIVIGLRPGKPLWVSASTSDMQEVMFALDWAKADMMDHVVREGRKQGEDETGGAA